MHAALQAIEAGAPPPRPAAVAAPMPAPARRDRLVFVLLGAGVLSVLAVLAGLRLSGSEAGRDAATAAGTTPVPAATAALAVEEPPVASPTVKVAMEPPTAAPTTAIAVEVPAALPTVEVAAEPPAVRATAPVAATPPPEGARAAPATVERSPAGTAPPADPPAIDADRVALAVASVEQAMRKGDLGAAAAAIGYLATMLPERSLTLQRMQAWHAHQSGATVEAIALYQAILQRVPGDRNAAINLALLEAAQGDVDGASRRLRELRASVGESAELAAAMAQVGAIPR